MAKIELDGDPKINRLNVDSRGDFYVVTHTGRGLSLLNKFSLSGRHLLTVDLTRIFKTDQVGIHDLFIARDNTLYLLVVWLTQVEENPSPGVVVKTFPSSGVVVFDTNGNFQRLIKIAPILFFHGRQRLVVDSRGAFYISGLHVRGRNPRAPLVTNNTIHKFSPSGELVTSFSPLTETFTRERCTGSKEYQALLIDSQDHIHHIYLDGTEIRTYRTDGRLLRNYRIEYPSRPRPLEKPGMPILDFTRGILGSFIWNDYILLSVTEAYSTTGGIGLGSADFYSLIIDPFENSRTVVDVEPGTIPPITLGRDGYCYAFSHHHDPQSGVASYVISKEALMGN